MLQLALVPHDPGAKPCCGAESIGRQTCQRPARRMRAARRRTPALARQVVFAVFLEVEPSTRRPRTRAECKNGPRPCPWFGCRYHLGLTVDEATGRVSLTWPGVELDEVPHSCALDEVAGQVDADGAWIGEEQDCERLASRFNVSGERVRQILQDGLAKLQRWSRRTGTSAQEARRALALLLASRSA